MCSESHSSKNKKKYFLELQKGTELTSTKFSHSIVQTRYYEFHWKKSVSLSLSATIVIRLKTPSNAPRTRDRERKILIRRCGPHEWIIIHLLPHFYYLSHEFFAFVCCRCQLRSKFDPSLHHSLI